jgi:hypothetical protein
MYTNVRIGFIIGRDESLSYMLENIGGDESHPYIHRWIGRDESHPYMAKNNEGLDASQGLRIRELLSLLTNYLHRLRILIQRGDVRLVERKGRKIHIIFFVIRKHLFGVDLSTSVCQQNSVLRVEALSTSSY